MGKVKYLVNGVEKSIAILDVYKTILKQHQINHIVIKMYNQVFLNFDEATFLYSLLKHDSDISRSIYFVNDVSFDEDRFQDSLNHFTKHNYNYTYTYKELLLIIKIYLLNKG